MTRFMFTLVLGAVAVSVAFASDSTVSDWSDTLFPGSSIATPWMADDDDDRSRAQFRTDDRRVRELFKEHENGDGEFWMRGDKNRNVGGATVKFVSDGTFEIGWYASGKKDVRGTWRDKGRDTMELTLREGFGRNRLTGKGAVYLSRDRRTFHEIQLRGRIDERRDNRDFELEFCSRDWRNDRDRDRNRDDRPDWLPDWLVNIIREGIGNDRDDRDNRDDRGRDQRTFECNSRIQGDGLFDFGDVRGEKVNAVRVVLAKDGTINVSVAGQRSRSFKGEWWEDRSGRVIFTLQNAGPNRQDAEGWITMDRDNRSFSRIEFSGGDFKNGVRLKFEEERR